MFGTCLLVFCKFEVTLKNYSERLFSISPCVLSIDCFWKHPISPVKKSILWLYPVFVLLLSSNQVLRPFMLEGMLSVGMKLTPTYVMRKVKQVILEIGLVVGLT